MEGFCIRGLAHRVLIHDNVENKFPSIHPRHLIKRAKRYHTLEISLKIKVLSGAGLCLCNHMIVILKPFMDPGSHLSLESIFSGATTLQKTNVNS